MFSLYAKQPVLITVVATSTHISQSSPLFSLALLSPLQHFTIVTFNLISGGKKRGGGEYPDLTPQERSRIYYKKWADKKPESLRLISRRRNKEKKEKRLKVIVGN